MALGAIMAVGWIVHDAAIKSQRASESVVHTYDVLQVVREVEHALSRAEFAQREFLNSGAERLVEERDNAFKTVTDSVARLDMLVFNSAAQSERTRALQHAVFNAISIMQRQGDRKAAGQEIAPNSEAFRNAKLALVKVNDLAAEMTLEEQSLLRARRLEQQRSFDLTMLLLKIAIVLAVIVVIPGYIAFMWQGRSRAKLEQKLFDLAESVPGTVYQFRVKPGEKPKFEVLSRGIESVLGVGRRSILRDPSIVWNAMHEDDREAFFAAIEQGFDSLLPVEQDFRIKPAGRDMKWLRSFAAPRQEGDGSVVWSGYWADVTRQKRLENELKEAKETADLATHAKSAFLAVMSHEIRTPMNGVLGMLELMSLSKLDADQRATLNIVRESGRSLQRIIDDILDFSKIEAGKLDISTETASIKTVVEGTRNIYIGNASSKGLLLVTHVDPAISPALRFDPLRVRQILNNLVSNAIKFTSQGEVRLAAELVERRDGLDIVRISVRDSGIGIPEDAQPRLFQPFAQASGTTARSFGGTGLGLTISKRLVEMMDGQIGIESVPGKGTTITVTLPLRIGDAKDLPEARVNPASQPALQVHRTAPSVAQAEREGTLVLIADDHSTNRLLITRQLNILGYAAETAENGLQALQKWQTGRFAAVISDVNMPELDGYELARRIRRMEADERRARTPIIACTANALRGEAESCLSAGMDDYLAKPVQLAELSAKLHQWLPLPPEQEPAATPDSQWAGSAAGAGAPSPIDRSVLAGVSDGVQSAEEDILADFDRSTARDAATLHRAVDGGDAKEINKVAHRIKGAARMVGANALAHVCERMEHAGDASDLEAAGEQIAVFDNELKRVRDFVSSFREKPIRESS